jgi:hypothetical protein
MGGRKLPPVDDDDDGDVGGAGAIGMGINGRVVLRWGLDDEDAGDDGALLSKDDDDDIAAVVSLIVALIGNGFGVVEVAIARPLNFAGGGAPRVDDDGRAINPVVDDGDVGDIGEVGDVDDAFSSSLVTPADLGDDLLFLKESLNELSANDNINTHKSELKGR